MISLFLVLQYMNPAVNSFTARVQSLPDQPETILEWDSSLGPQPTQAQIDAANPLAKSALCMTAIRAERDRRIAATDYQAMPDYPAAKRPAGLDAYRNALRDFPATLDPATVPWPLDIAALNWPGL